MGSKWERLRKERDEPKVLKPLGCWSGCENFLEPRFLTKKQKLHLLPATGTERPIRAEDREENVESKLRTETKGSQAMFDLLSMDSIAVFTPATRRLRSGLGKAESCRRGFQAAKAT